MGLDVLRATSHTILKAHDHCILRSLIGRKGRDYPSSVETRSCMPKDPKTLSWMKKCTWTLFIAQYILTFHGLLEFALTPPARGSLDANFGKLCQSNMWYRLWIRVKGPHNYVVMGIGSCVKWP